jgi:hypothetical protein
MQNDWIWCNRAAVNDSKNCVCEVLLALPGIVAQTRTCWRSLLWMELTPCPCKCNYLCFHIFSSNTFWPGLINHKVPQYIPSWILYFTPLSSKYFLNSLLWDTCNFCSSFKVIGYISQPYKTTQLSSVFRKVSRIIIVI